MKLNKIAYLMLIAVVSCTSKDVKVEYKGENISENASIVRNKANKQTVLEIDIDGKWEIYSGKSVEAIDTSNPILSGDTSGEFDLPVDTVSRSYFLLKTDKGQAILAERHLPMDGGHNFRDLGGIRTQEGRYVKWGQVFRSDELCNLTDADLNYLDALPLTSVVDFRSEEEIRRAPDKTPTSVEKNYALNIDAGKLLAEEVTKRVSEDSIAALMVKMNQSFILDTAIVAQYKIYFELLQNKKKTPLMFHCSAGKDRTGIAAALFLYSLGVDDATVMNDYLLSNIYVKDKYAPIVAQYPHTIAVLEVRREYLQASLDLIKEKYGTVNHFLESQLGVDIANMKQLYLYNP